jgi:hypothetical protein
MDGVFMFCGVQGARVIGDGVPASEGVRLFEDRTYGEITGIDNRGVHTKRFEAFRGAVSVVVLIL